MLDLNKIGQKIACLRKARNMTQAALAEELYVSYQAVSSWERGLTVPDVERLKALARIFDCTIEEIIGEEGETVDKIAVGQTPALDEIAKVAAIICPQKLDELVRSAIGEQKTSISIETLIAVAPFIGRELLGTLLDGIDGLTIGNIITLMPFLDADKLNDIACRLHIDDPKKLVILAPFLKKEKLRSLADMANAPPEVIVMLSPFLYNDTSD